MNVEEVLISDAEGLLGFVDLAYLHLLEARRDDLFLHTQQTSVEVTLTHWLTLKNNIKHKQLISYVYTHINITQKLSLK